MFFEEAIIPPDLTSLDLDYEQIHSLNLWRQTTVMDFTPARDTSAMTGLDQSQGISKQMIKWDMCELHSA